MNRFKVFNSNERELILNGLNESFNFYENYLTRFKKMNSSKFDKAFIKTLKRDFKTSSILLKELGELF